MCFYLQVILPALQCTYFSLLWQVAAAAENSSKVGHSTSFWNPGVVLVEVQDAFLFSARKKQTFSRRQFVYFLEETKLSWDVFSLCISPLTFHTLPYFLKCLCLFSMQENMGTTVHLYFYYKTCAANSSCLMEIRNLFHCQTVRSLALSNK